MREICMSGLTSGDWRRSHVSPDCGGGAKAPPTSHRKANVTAPVLDSTGGDLGMIEEREQVVADLGISLAQSPSIAIDRRERDDGVERAFKTASILAACAVGKIAVAPRQHDRAQQQRLHARGEHRVASVDGILGNRATGGRDRPARASAWPCWAP